MAFLYEKYNTLSEYGAIDKNLPRYLIDNLRPRFALRPYQIEAFARFIYFWEHDESSEKQPRPYHLLYNMATGSGKTNIMAGLVLYMYQQGYRDFLFFVNSNAVIEKTRDIFLNERSAKYVFNERITFDSREVKVKEVETFDESDPDNINIKFTTIQQLHIDLENPKENSLCYDDFTDRKIVMLADEADNFNVATRNQNTLDGNWENTIRRIHEMNYGNVLLEFTATMDLDTPEIRQKYENKTIFKYDLKEFRVDGYSKEIEIMKSRSEQRFRVYQALILNLYRQVLAAEYGINLKPVILFKAKRTIAESERNMASFHKWIEELTAENIDLLRDATEIDEVVKRAFAYFDKKQIHSPEIVLRTKSNFRQENCISANNDAEKERNQMLLNSLEDENNPIRAVFAVNKLDRGWDVLNLFDIVRMYDERNEERGGRIGNTTRAEAQLIGRGARYFPFRIEDGQDLFTRKYDNDRSNNLRILETLYYHTIDESRYIAEIKKALAEQGSIDPTSVTKTLELKLEFKETDFYKNAKVVFNTKKPKDYQSVKSLADLSVRKTNYRHLLTTMASSVVGVFGEQENGKELKIVEKDVPLSVIPYHIIRYALTTNPFYRFNNIRRYCPNLKSSKEFVEDNAYLGVLEITFKGTRERLEAMNHYDYLLGVQGLLSQIEKEIKANNVEYEGSDFFCKPIRDVFKTKPVTFPKDEAREEGQIDMLREEHWYAYNANYGTSEERAFIEMFARRYSSFQKKYDDIYVIRNEKVVKIVDAKGRVFEPDFLLFARQREEEHLMFQIFIEPKGNHLKGKDKWKEEYLEKMRKERRTMSIDTDKYLITGVPFYNLSNENEFISSLEGVLNIESK